MNTIRCEGISKRFLQSNQARLLGARLLGRAPDWFWALQDIEMTIDGPGRRLGIVGANGSGKTTLLRIIGGVTRPTSGTVVVHGRVISLLELFAGMQMELTGRENLYLYGTILGMRRREIQRKLDSIIAFAGVERFLNMPLRHYSLGMMMRLGFSVAVHVDAEIMLVDEVWGIGDVGFQEQSFEQIRRLQARGVTSVIVTHDAAIIRQLTDEVLWLRGGRVAAFGPTETVVTAYLAAMSEPSASPPAAP